MMTKQLIPILKPCPECKEEVFVQDMLDNTFFVRPRRFSHCKYYRRHSTDRNRRYKEVCQTKCFNTIQEAIKAWNKRG